MASDIIGPTGPGGNALQFDSLPRTVLQSIYNAVTGKTENLSKVIEGNVLIEFNDIRILHDMIIDQLNLHTTEFGPTVTVVVKHINHKSVTYSSWERFIDLQVNSNDVTSEVTIRFEFVLRLPATAGPQKCILNVNIDSSLPVIMNSKMHIDAFEQAGLFFFVNRPWNTVKVSIDFVDYLIAKSFCGVVEEWFETLRRTPIKKFNDLLIRYVGTMRIAVGQLGRIGFAAYLAFYAYFERDRYPSITTMAFAVAVGLFLQALIVIVESNVTPKLHMRIMANIVPSIILLTKRDNETYATVIEKMNSPARTIAGFFCSLLLAVALNIFSSFIYAYFF